MSRFVVTTSVSGHSRCQVWDASSPLPIGYPLRWVLENTPKGVRVRYLAAQIGSVTQDGVQEFTHEMLRNGASVKLPSGSGKNAPVLTLQIKASTEIKPAFRNAHKAEKIAPESLCVYSCSGNWVLTTQALKNRYVGYLYGKTAFTITGQGTGFQLSPEIERLELFESDEDSSPARALVRGQGVPLTPEQLVSTTIRYQVDGAKLSWRFSPASAPALAERAQEVEPDITNNWFKRSMQSVTAALVLLLGVAWLMPQQEVPKDELIPPQVAKIILSKPKKKEEPAPAGGSPAGPQGAVKKAKDAAVVQAFRAKALQHAVSGLLKGGMTKLLGQSDFVGGATSQSARSILGGSKSGALAPSGLNVGLVGNTGAAVTGIGGGGGGKGGAGGGTGVGYGTGERAGVGGQGKSFVSMDTGGSSVEEGLSKDEVGAVIHKHISEVRYCYESAMIRTPDIEGKLIVNFTIGANGMVKSTSVNTSTLPDPRLDDCIMRRLMTWKFPNPKGGIDVAVTYPFIFKTLGR